MSCGDELYPAAKKRIHDIDVLFARHSENDFKAFVLKTRYEPLCRFHMCDALLTMTGRPNTRLSLAEVQNRFPTRRTWIADAGHSDQGNSASCVPSLTAIVNLLPCQLSERRQLVLVTTVIHDVTDCPISGKQRIRK